MRLFSCVAALALFVPPAFAGQAMILALQTAAPVQITSIRHGLNDAIEAANFHNRSDKNISAYRVGWATTINQKVSFKSGVWMNMPVGVLPGTNQTVPAQGISLMRQAQKMIFFISDVRFADGSHWKTDRKSILKQ